MENTTSLTVGAARVISTSSDEVPAMRVVGIPTAVFTIPNKFRLEKKITGEILKHTQYMYWLGSHIEDIIGRDCNG